MEEEKELRMYRVTQRVLKTTMILAENHDDATKKASRREWLSIPTEEIKSQSITEFNPLKSNEEVEKDDQETKDSLRGTDSKA
jgi:hypothetical protein